MTIHRAGALRSARLRPIRSNSVDAAIPDIHRGESRFGPKRRAFRWAGRLAGVAGGTDGRPQTGTHRGGRAPRNGPASARGRTEKALSPRAGDLLAHAARISSPSSTILPQPSVTAVGRPC